MGNLGLVGIADYPGDAGQGSQLFGSALGVAAGYDEANSRVCGVKLADGFAGLGVGRRGDGAGVDDNDVGSGYGGVNRRRFRRAENYRGRSRASINLMFEMRASFRDAVTSGGLA